MRLRVLTATAALALTITCQTTSADEPSATDRCIELMDGDELIEEAITVCAVAANESREGLVLYGDILSAKDDVKGAIEHYSKALEGVDPSQYEGTTLAALRRRAIEYYYIDDATSAFNDATAYLRFEPEDDEILFLAAATASSAQTGLPFIERAIAGQPNDVMNYVLHAQLLLRAGKKKEALATADRAIKIAPKDHRAHMIKGFVYGSTDEYAKAERAYAQAVKLSPKDPQPKANRAYALVELRRYEEAIAVATDAINDDPKFFDALHIRANAYLAMGDGDAALADIKRAEGIEPRWNAEEERTRAEKLVEVHRTLSPAGISKIQADRELTLRGITRHLHSQCTDYRLPQFSPGLDIDQVNADLGRYRDCLRTWVSIPEIEIYDSLTPAEVAAGERLYDAKNLIVHEGEELRCSKMPKRSKCIQDAMFTKVEPLMNGADEPIQFVRNLEIERFNADLAALNKAIDRHNTGVAIADFLQGVADALNEQ